MKRVFVPKVGEMVKLRDPVNYLKLTDKQRELGSLNKEIAEARERRELTAAEAEKRYRTEVEEVLAAWCKTHDVPTVWAWFDVLAADEKTCRLRHTMRALNAPDPAWEGEVPTEWIEAPFGWASTYTITCSSKEKADKVVNEWFGRGIHVWANHDLSSSGGEAFTPFGAGVLSENAPSEEGKDKDGTQPASPGWRYTGKPSDSVPAELCPKVFCVTWLEGWEPQLPRERRAREKAIKELRGTGVSVAYNRRGGGFWRAERTTVVYEPPKE